MTGVQTCALPILTRTAIRAALDEEYRHLDCAERYGNEAKIDEVIQACHAACGLSRETVFIAAKPRNTNRRWERVQAGRNYRFCWTRDQ